MTRLNFGENDGDETLCVEQRLTYGMEDKVVVITGAGNGIGQGTALLFSREGARVVVADIDETAGRETQRRIAHEGGKALFIRADVSRDDDVKAMVERAIQSWGRI